jgi:hypothetical protein
MAIIWASFCIFVAVASLLATIWLLSLSWQVSRVSHADWLRARARHRKRRNFIAALEAARSPS